MKVLLSISLLLVIAAVAFGLAGGLKVFFFSIGVAALLIAFVLGIVEVTDWVFYSR